ncbi:MAG: acyl--CoA ligase [Solirubrobacterales bacterium]|nr:acyl--CoA ligase [Solirubrobacterales bacterium]
MPLKDTPFAAVSEMTVHELFERRVAETPGALAVRSVQGEMTFAEWRERADSLRALFERIAGALRGERIALWMTNDEAAAYLGALQATLGAGAIAVPLDDRMAVPEARRVFAEADPRLLVISRLVAERIGEAGLSDLGVASPTVPAAGVEAVVLHLSDGLTTEDPVSWDPATAAEARPSASPAQPGDDGLIAFTSGSTGKPKGAMWTQMAICQYAERVAHGIHSEPRGGKDLGETDVLQSPIPLYTAASVIENIYPTVFSGCTLVFEGRRFDPEASQERMAEFGTTVYNGVPPHLALMCDRSAREGAAPELILTSGSPLTGALYRRVRDRWPSTAVVNWYGLNESGTGQLINYGPDMEREPQAIGRPVWPTEIRVVDPDGTDVEPGEPGELWMRSPGQMHEYFRSPEQTAERLYEGWLRTGDHVRMDFDGLVHVVGRGEERINRGGFKYYPAEVEAALEEHPAVRKAAIVAIPHPVLGQDTVAFVELTGDPDEKELRDHVKGQIAANKVPSRVFPIDELPLGAYGKVQRKALLERFEQMEKTTVSPK